MKIKISSSRLPYLIVTLFIFITVFTVIIFFFSERNSKINAEINKGIEVLKAMESRDFLSMEDQINLLKNKTIDPNDLPALFDSSVVVGDSIAEGLGLYETLNPSSLVAYLGNSVATTLNEVSTIVNLQPRNIFFELGLNDISHPNRNLDTFMADYEKLIDAVKAQLPNTTIYITSIFPVSPSLLSERPEFLEIEAYNAALKELAKKKTIHYIDTYSFGKASEHLHTGDGIHYLPEFYPLWVNTLVQNSVLSKV